MITWLARIRQGLACHLRGGAGLADTGDLLRADEFAILGADDFALPALNGRDHFGVPDVGVGGDGEALVEDFLVARHEPALDQAQRGEIADLVDAVAIAQVFGLAAGRPVVPGAQGGGATRVPATLAFIVVLGAIAPGIVRRLVVVPAHDPGRCGVQRLQVGIGLVLGVASDVVRMGDDLVPRIRDPVQRLGIAGRVFAHRVFVDVVAEVENEVELVILGRLAIGVEMAGREVGAGKDPDPEGGDVALGQRARDADGRVRVVQPKAVEIALPRLEPGSEDLQRAQRLGLDVGDVLTLFEDDVGKTGIAGHLHTAPAAAILADRGPKHHAGRVGVA